MAGLYRYFKNAIYCKTTPPPTIRVYVNKKLLKFDIDPFITNGRLMILLRELCDALYIDVSWDNETKRAITGKMKPRPNS